MKKIIKQISAISAVVLGLSLAAVAFAGSAHWSYPGAYTNDVTMDYDGPSTTIVQSKPYGSGLYHATSSVSAGDRVAVVIYFHNDGDAPAQNVTFRMNQPSGSSSTFQLTGTITESGGATKTGTTTVNISSPQTLTYIPNSIRLYKENQWTTPTAISGISDGSEIFSSGVNIGTIPGKNDCPSGNPVCHQGSLAIGFRVSSDSQVQNPCQITSFYASPSNVQYGSSTVLNWTTQNCTNFMIDGTAYPLNGSQSFGPLYNTRTYYATASGPVGTDAKNATVTVTNQQSYCQITNFNASPSNVQNGGYVTLSWNSTGGNNFQIDGISYPTNGSGTFGPVYNSRTYTATLSGTNCSDTKNVYVSVQQQPQQYCQVTNFYASPSNVSYGGYTTLSWNTTGATSVTIDGISYPASGSGTFGPVYNSRTYYLSASGYNCSDSRSAYVSVQQQPTYQYQCSDNLDNDGDGRIDYPNDPGCTSSQDNDEYNQIVVPVTPSVITVPATNITRTTAQLNGIATNAGNYQTNLYFEWGSTASLGNRTQNQTAFATADVSFFEVLTGLTPNSTYYFRAVAQNPTGIYKGDIKSFTTLSNPVVITTPIPEPPVVIRRAVNLGLGTNLVQLKFQDQFGANGVQNACVGDVATWTLYYKNISGNVLNNVILHIDLPKDVAYRSSSGGIYNAADNSLTFNVGTLQIDQEGFVTVSGEVLESAAGSGLLVMTATLSFENPINSARETAVAYGLINAGVCRSNLAGLALFGAGFWPTSLIGWLILILVLLALIWLIRALVIPAVVVHRHRKENGKYYEDMDVPTAPYRG